MNNIVSLFGTKNKKPKGRPDDLHDTLRQIALSQQPSSVYWLHACQKVRMDNIKTPIGCYCPLCKIDEYGDHHPNGTA